MFILFFWPRIAHKAIADGNWREFIYEIRLISPNDFFQRYSGIDLKYFEQFEETLENGYPDTEQFMVLFSKQQTFTFCIFNFLTD